MTYEHGTWQKPSRRPGLRRVGLMLLLVLLDRQAGGLEWRLRVCRGVVSSEVERNVALLVLYYRTNWRGCCFVASNGKAEDTVNYS